MRALIVDDDPTSRLLLTRILVRDFGCACAEADNGLDALDLLSRERYDFVVLDLVMPVMDGLEVLTAIRHDERLKSTPVVVVTSERDADVVRRVLRLGVSSYVAKPLRPADVADRLRRFVSALGQREQSSSRLHRDLPKGARVLVVDGDGDFLHFVRATIGHEYLVAAANSGAQGLRSILDGRPAIVLLGRELGAVSPKFFVRKVRELAEVQDTRIITVGHPADAEPLDVDGAIVRTFVPDTFRKYFEGLTSAVSPEARWLTERPMLRPQLISATEQVLGMMLGWEVSALPDAPVVHDAWHSAEVPILLEQGDCQCRVQLKTPSVVAGAMAEAMLGTNDLTEDDAASTIQEMSNMIGGRILEALRQHGDRVRLGLPVVTTSAVDAASDGPHFAVSFGADQLPAPFRVLVHSAAGAA
jgi:CheY-like chemotaxis protein/CheY-specific phosphatase CheX